MNNKKKNTKWNLL